MARAVADKLGPRLGQTVVVENKPGASNTLAADLAAKSGDAHTMVMGVSTAHAIAPHLLKLGYDNDRDLTPVVFVGAVPNILVVNNQVPARTVQELIALLGQAGRVQLRQQRRRQHPAHRGRAVRTPPACGSRTFPIAAAARPWST